MTELKDFNAVAATWDAEPRRVRLAAGIVAAVREAVPLDPGWLAMDFGCGTGLVTLGLAPVLGQIVGVDSSPGMLEQLERKLNDAGITNVATAPADQVLSGAAGPGFDLITSAMTLHHVPDLPALLAALHRLLKPGGWIALADLESEDGSFHDDPTGVFHHGFSASRMEELLGEAGFRQPAVRRAACVTKGEREYPVLLATARS